MPASWKLLLRATGAFALLIFLLPTVYVVKYYALDKPREVARARLVSLTRISQTVSLASIAPPLVPTAPGNAAAFYMAAINSYAKRASSEKNADVPTPAEASYIFEGARRQKCQFFDAKPALYPFPRTPTEKYQYLSAAVRLARAMANVPQSLGQGSGERQEMIGRAIIRFGDALGRERATRTHLQVARIVKTFGLRLLLPKGGNALKQYVYSQQAFDDAIQAKYALLEPVSADNILLQEKVARQDADPMWRREAVWALGTTLETPGIGWQRPLETLTAKATLAEAAVRDPEPSIREAAQAMLGEVARRGAVIRR